MVFELHPTSAIGCEYDPFDPQFNSDPHIFYARARRDAPVCYCPQLDLWLVTGYDEAMAVIKDPLRFSSASIMNPPLPWPAAVQAILSEGYPFAPGLLNNDPPAHTRVRELFSTAFTPRRVAALEPRVRALAHQLVDNFAAQGQADLVPQLLHPLPMQVIAELVGLPQHDLPKIRILHDHWLDLYKMNLSLEELLVEARGVVEYQRYYAALIGERRVNPRDDLLTSLVEARLEGTQPFSDAEIISQLIILTSAGHETTTGALSAILYLLHSHPEQWQAILANPTLIPVAIEESIRLSSPAQMVPRVTTEQVELGGVTIPAGSRLHVVYAAANRDVPQIDDPDHFNIFRTGNNRHLGFGWGIHFCIGAALARLEIRVVIEVLIERLPNLRLAPGFVPEYAPSFFVRCISQLPMLWDVAPAEAAARTAV